MTPRARWLVGLIATLALDVLGAVTLFAVVWAAGWLLYRGLNALGI